MKNNVAKTRQNSQYKYPGSILRENNAGNKTEI